MKLLIVANIDPRKRHKVITEPLKSSHSIETEIIETGIIKGMINYKIKMKTFDYVFIFNDGLKNLIFILFCKFMSTKVILRLGGNPLVTRKQVLKKMRLRSNPFKIIKQSVNYKLAKYIIKYVDGFVFNSTSLQQDILNIRGSLCISQVIPQYILPHTQLPIRPFNKEVKLLTVTSLDYESKYKGLKFIIDSLEKIQNEGSLQMEFHVVCPGLHHEDMKSYINSKNFGRQVIVKIHDFIKDLEYLYLSCDIFLYCSELDSLPNVLIEAKKYGLPAVVNDYPPILDLVEDRITANVFSLGNYKSFKKAMMELINDYQLRRKMGERNFSQIKRDFSLERTRDKIENFLLNNTHA